MTDARACSVSSERWYGLPMYPGWRFFTLSCRAEEGTLLLSRFGLGHEHPQCLVPSHRDRTKLSVAWDVLTASSAQSGVSVDRE